jgi:hypothetical protein
MRELYYSNRTIGTIRFLTLSHPPARLVDHSYFCLFQSYGALGAL